MSAMNSKTYFIFNSHGNCKLSTKGLSKNTNDFTIEDFIRVLETRVTGSGINHGLRPMNNEILQYIQERSGLNYLYVKRDVLDDGVSTRALHV